MFLSHLLTIYGTHVISTTSVSTPNISLNLLGLKKQLNSWQSQSSDFCVQVLKCYSHKTTQALKQNKQNLQTNSTFAIQTQQFWLKPGFLIVHNLMWFF